jgi:superfamily II DNA or RNA helicase
MTGPEELILSFYAYCGDFMPCTQKYVEVVMHQCFSDVTDDVTESLCTSLHAAGLLETQTRYGAPMRLVICKDYELIWVVSLYQKHRDDWVVLFDSLSLGILDGKHKSLEFRHWFLIVLGLVDGNPSPCPSLPRRQTEMIADVLDDVLWNPVVEQLPCMVWTECLEKKISNAFHLGSSLDWDYLAKLAGLFSEEDGSNSYLSALAISNQADFFGLYRYLATGNTAKTDWGKSCWSDLYQAISNAYGRNYQVAVNYFTEALRGFDKHKLMERGVFDDYVFNYYYVVCLILEASDGSVRKLGTLRGKHIMVESALYGGTLHKLIRYRLDAQPFNLTDSQIELGACNPISARLACSLLAYFSGKPLKNDVTTHWTVIENEIEAGKSLLHRIRRMEPWEILLDDVDRRKVGDISVLEERLIYILNAQNMVVAPFIQRKDVHGRWKELQVIYNNNNRDIPECATDEDRKILSRLRPGEMLFKGVDGLIPFVGCDHVFLKQRQYEEDLLQVYINIEKPYLIVEQQRDGPFNISSNLSSDELNQTATSFLRRVDDTHYQIVQMHEWEYPIYRLMLSLGSLPSSSADRLRATLARLDGNTEIHSNLIHDDEPVLEADSRLVLRIHPYQHNSPLWRIKVLTVPFPNSQYASYPGEGEAIGMMEVDGTRKMVKRYFEGELLNLSLFVDYARKIDVIYNDEGAQDIESARIDLDNLLDIITWAREHPDVAVVDLMDGCKFNVVDTAKPAHLRLNLLPGNVGWFKATGVLVVSNEFRLTVVELIREMNQGEGRYVRIDDNNFVHISDDLRKMVNRMRAISKQVPSDKNDALQMPALAVATLDDSFDEVISCESYDARTLRTRVKESHLWNADVPDTLNGQLKHYQMDGYRWMARTLSWGAGVCLADDMGLGKTIQAIAVMLSRVDDGPSLVVAPTSVVPNWRNELHRFAPSLKAIVLNDCGNREELVCKATSGHIIIVSYGMLVSQESIITSRCWNVACLDEAHAIKNRMTKTAHAAMHIEAANRIVLTGTPVQNHFSDLWGLFQFVNPGMLGSYQTFLDKFANDQDIDECEVMAEQLNSIVSPFILRRTKDEVLSELPGIDDNIRYVTLSPEEMVIYDATRKATKKKFSESDQYSIDRQLSAVGAHKISALAMLTKLRELVCSNSLVMMGWQKRSSKEEAFLDLLQEIDLDHNHVLVFSQFTSFLQEIQGILDSEGISYLYLDGSTPMKQRENLIAQFQEGNAPLFLVSLKAGGVGLNLTQANYVVHLDPWWNPAIEQQATDRAYRIGQDQHVSVFHLIAKDTIEEKILDLQERKHLMSETLLSGTDISSRLTQEDILKLLSD